MRIALISKIYCFYVTRQVFFFIIYLKIRKTNVPPFVITHHQHISKTQFEHFFRILKKSCTSVAVEKIRLLFHFTKLFKHVSNVLSLIYKHQQIKNFEYYFCIYKRNIFLGFLVSYKVFFFQTDRSKKKKCKMHIMQYYDVIDALNFHSAGVKVTHLYIFFFLLLCVLIENGLFLN